MRDHRNPTNAATGPARRRLRKNRAPIELRKQMKEKEWRYQEQSQPLQAHPPRGTSTKVVTGASSKLHAVCGAPRLRHFTDATNFPSINIRQPSRVTDVGRRPGPSPIPVGGGAWRGMFVQKRGSVR